MSRDGLWCRTRAVRAVGAFVAMLVLLVSCEVNDRVDARMRRPEVTDRFAEADDSDDESDAETTTTTTELPDPSDLDDIIDDGAGAGRSVGATHVGTGFWEIEVDARGGMVRVRADIEFDLVGLTPEQLVEFGVVEEGQENLFSATRWFAVQGVVTHDLVRSGCEADPNFDSCRVARATDGSIVGLASILNGRADIVMQWRTLGRGSEPATPRLSVQTVNEGGFSSTVELRDLAESLESRVIGQSVKVDVDAGARVVQSIGGNGRGEIELSTID